jgi:tetratricopeptide (TPR) repeat protein
MHNFKTLKLKFRLNLDSFFVGVGYGDWQPPNQDYEQIIAECSARIGKNADDVPAHYARACAYVGKGDCDRAIADFTELVRLDPKDAEALRERGHVYYFEGDNDMAIADFSATLRTDGEIADAHYGCGCFTGGEANTTRPLANYQGDRTRSRDRLVILGAGLVLQPTQGYR